MHVQPAERRVAGQHTLRGLGIEPGHEGFGRDVLDGRAAPVGREQAGAGEVGEHDGHAAIVPASGGLTQPSGRHWPGKRAMPVSLWVEAFRTHPAVS